MKNNIHEACICMIQTRACTESSTMQIYYFFAFVKDSFSGCRILCMLSSVGSELLLKAMRKSLTVDKLQTPPVAFRNVFVAQGHVDFKRSPRVGSGVSLLGVAKYLGIPVREALRL